MKRRPAQILGVALGALALGGCAQVAAPDEDLRAPTPNTALTATAANGFFSSIPGTPSVASVSLTHFTSAEPAPAFAQTGSNGQAVTFTFTPAAPNEFLNGDVLTVTWSAEAVSIVGSHYTVRHSATYSFHGRVGK